MSIWLRCVPSERSSRSSLEGSTSTNEAWKGSVLLANLSTDEYCAELILEFLESTDVGGRTGGEQVGNGTAEEQEKVWEGDEELMEVGCDDGGV